MARRLRTGGRALANALVVLALSCAGPKAEGAPEAGGAPDVGEVPDAAGAADAREASDAPDDRSVGSPTSIAEDEDGGSAAARIEVVPEAICPGQCASVRALGARSDPPSEHWQWLWQPELANGPGPHQLCPDASVDIRLSVVADPSQSDEFTVPNEEVSAPLRVRDDCAVAWTQTAAPTCTTRIDSETFSLNDIGGDSAVLVVGSFDDELSIGDQDFVAQPYGGGRGLVAKYDAQCRLVWAFKLASSRMTNAQAVAATPDGGLVVGGVFDDDADLGGPILWSIANQDMFLVKYSVSGQYVWQRHFINVQSSYQHQAVTGISVDSVGNITVTGSAANGIDFGGGKLAPGGADRMVEFVLKLNPAGAHIYTHLPAPIFHPRAVTSGTSTMIAGRTEGVLSWGGVTQGTPGVLYNALAELDAAGAPTWSSLTMYGGGAYNPSGGSGPHGLAAGTDGTVYRGHVAKVAADEVAFSIMATSPDGSSLWHGPDNLHVRSTDPFRVAHRVAVGGDGTLWQAGTYDGSRSVAGRDLATRGETDAVLLRLNDHGEATWAGAFGTEFSEDVNGLHATPTGSAFLVGRIRNRSNGRGVYVAHFDPNASSD